MKKSHRANAGRWLPAAALVFLIALRAAGQDAADPQLAALIAEAAERNPAVQAARREAAAVRSRIAPAGALDDPMLEVGVPIFRRRRSASAART